MEKNNIEHPSHYCWLEEVSGIEPIEIIRHFNYNRGAALKYIIRAGHKDPNKEIEDLKKAIWYLNDEIKMLEINETI